MEENTVLIQRLEMLKKEHRELDKQAAELSQRLYLTEEEKELLAALKKEKLAKKDQIYQLSMKLGIEM